MIVLGIRAYASRPELAANNGRLLEYVRNGGNLVVQYQSGEYDHGYGPYPYTLGRSPEKVVDETAPVTLLEPKNPLLTWPNQITPEDFNGWVEERGHSFMQSWDPKYTALTEVHDPGQDPQKGGLLVAHEGKGPISMLPSRFTGRLPRRCRGRTGCWPIWLAPGCTLRALGLTAFVALLPKRHSQGQDCRVVVSVEMREGDLFAGAEGQAQTPRLSLGVAGERDAAEDNSGGSKGSVFPSLGPPSKKLELNSHSGQT